MARLQKIAPLLLAAALIGVVPVRGHAEAPTPTAVVTTYADLAQAVYRDAHQSAVALKAAVDALLADPTDATLAKARTAYLPLVVIRIYTPSPVYLRRPPPGGPASRRKPRSGIPLLLDYH